MEYDKRATRKMWKKGKCNTKWVQHEEATTWNECNMKQQERRCNMKRVQHEKSATRKKLQHEMSATLSNTQKKCNMKWTQYEKNITRKKYNINRVQHEATGKNMEYEKGVNWKDCTTRKI